MHVTVTFHSKEEADRMVACINEVEIDQPRRRKYTIAKLASLARMCGWLALDAEKAEPELRRAEYLRGKAAGYLCAARKVKEIEAPK